VCGARSETVNRRQPGGKFQITWATVFGAALLTPLLLRGQETASPSREVLTLEQAVALA